jgi:HK97 family phage major capsid protein
LSNKIRPTGAATRKVLVMARLIDLKAQRQFALDKADNLVRAAELAKRDLSHNEDLEVSAAMTAVTTLNKQISGLEKVNTISRMQDPSTGAMLMGNPGAGPRAFQKPNPQVLSPEYANEFFEYLSSDGKKIGATLYETGGGSVGGYAVPSVVDDQIVPLAPQEMAVRQLSTVLGTVSDIKFPTKTAFGTAAVKAETSSFGGTQMTIGTFTLSAFMLGSQGDVSWELVQDVPSFQQTTLNDMLLSQQMLEEGFYVTGTGTGQPQGIIGNIGAGVTEEPDSSGNMVSIAGTLDLIGKLNEAYAPNASWLMSRATSIIIRKAQVGANLFNPAWTRVGNQDYLHGFPVAYSASMPAATRGNTPVVFGDFKRGYLIGDRGGSGINVKVLDQPKAAQGLITLLTYRRTDGRVRLSEALQGYTIAAS